MNAKLLSVSALVFLACGPGFNQPCGGPHEVVASLSSVTLANDCGGGAQATADLAGACAQGSVCPSLCRQSSMQLSFGSNSISDANVEIRAVRLMDSKSNKVLQTLTSRSPQQWSAESYIAWDEIVPAGAGLKTTYKLSAPSFNYPAASDSDARFGYQTYSVEVDVAIDGQVQTLQASATREPEVAT